MSQWLIQILFGRSIDPQYPASNFGAPTCAGRTCFWGSTGVTGVLYATELQGRFGRAVRLTDERIAYPLEHGELTGRLDKMEETL